VDQEQDISILYSAVYIYYTYDLRNYITTYGLRNIYI